MKKFFIPICVLTLALTLPALAAQPPVPKDGYEIKGSKKTVLFNHSTHTTIECGTCHHKVDNKENFQKCATAGCHDNLTEKKGEKSLFYMMHTKEGVKYDTCMSCHIKIVAEKPDLKKDLTGCAKSKCHP